jgi:hypothetical protein
MQQCYSRSLLDRIVATVASFHIATMTFNSTVAFDIIVAFVILLVALLTSLREHLWNLCVLQRVHLPNLVRELRAYS